MINIGIGTVLLAATVALFMWAKPKDGQQSRLMSKWGMDSMLPIFILCLGIAGIVMVAKGFYP